MAQLDRITQDPEVKGGKPCIRGMRVTVGMIVGRIGAPLHQGKSWRNIPIGARGCASGAALCSVARRRP